jgi:uncharacterized protein with HEPN domain
MRSLVARLADAKHYANAAASYVKDIGFAEFSIDPLRRQGVCFCLMIVGEACTEAAKQLSAQAPEVPWAQIRGMRNILIHEYWQIDDEIVYNVARNEAAALAARFDRLLKGLT